ncbi:DUF4157 domain-containing protein [Ascidiimonas sp. W6]|uniref:eCIS core domain-containing protein n=1 Tax=Ascidiimonas meishanensis TaxID=3128903 RepID=UPI0030ED602D
MRQHVKQAPKTVNNTSGKLGTQSFKNQRPAQVKQLKLQHMANQSTVNNGVAIMQQKANVYTATTSNPIQAKANSTGLPDTLKSGIENLSGHSMDDVKVHYNSPKPAQLQAHAYAQGNQIHLASGQEKHLPHEAWHVVQQKQGRVKPTRQLQAKVAINDDMGLEKEADIMGAKALQMKSLNSFVPSKVLVKPTSLVVQAKILTKDGMYDHTHSLPPTQSVNLALTAASNNQQTYFVENNKDIQAIGSSKGAQLVGPYVHIIGENHSASKWALIKKKWGYTGKITYEELSDSATVKSSETAHHLATDADVKRENILENLHAKNITDLVVALYGSKRLKSIYSNMKLYLESDNDVEATKMKAMGEQTRKTVSSQLSDFDFYWNMDYVKAGKTASQKAEDTRTHAEKILVHLMSDKGAAITKDLKKLKANPIGLFTFKTPTKINELETWINYAATLTKNIEMVIELLHALIEEETKPGDAYGMNLALTEQRKRIGAIGANTSDHDVLDSASPLREHFMTLRLRAMGAPSIAVMGHAHRDNLKKTKPIPQDKYYDDYNDFVAKTTSKA